MKNTSKRVRSNATRAAAKVQSSKETTAPNVVAYQRRGSRGALSITHAGRKCAQVPFDSALTEYVESAAARAELNVAEFVEALIANHRERNGAGERAGDDWRKRGEAEEELNRALDQSDALYHLLEHNILRPMEGVELGDDLEAGLVELGVQTSQRVRAAVAALKSSPGDSPDVTFAEREALKHVVKSHESHHPADLEGWADQLCEEGSLFRLAARAVRRVGQEAWKGVGAR
ncbi:MAG: hypothetical protein IH623_27835 [Verrucomicrobia bacterium]|nr:hypothetical protein [Verrucomicrobiota bacterium]